MRLAVVEVAPFGGLLHYAVQLGDALAAHGHDVDLIVCRGHELATRPGPARRTEVLPAGPRPPGERASRLSVLGRRLGAARWRLGTWAQIALQARRGAYDAIILNAGIDRALSVVGAFALIALSGRARVTDVCHNVRPYNRWGGDELFVSAPLTLALLRRLYPAFDLVFVHGERSLREMEETWPGTRVAVIPHGDEGIFSAEPPAPAPEPRILFFGDWRKVKGLPVLMEAFDLLAARRPDVRLTIAGSPSPEEGESERVRRWAGERGERVALDPRYVPVEEVPGLFARARVVVLPYLVGYQSGVLHLAMTMGRAVVASDVGDLGSAVENGVTGLLVPPGDPAALAAALETVLDDAARAAQMGLRGRERLQRAASWPTVAERVEAALAEVLG